MSRVVLELCQPQRVPGRLRLQLVRRLARSRRRRRRRGRRSSRSTSPELLLPLRLAASPELENIRTQAIDQMKQPWDVFFQSCFWSLVKYLNTSDKWENSQSYCQPYSDLTIKAQGRIVFCLSALNLQRHFFCPTTNQCEGWAGLPSTNRRLFQAGRGGGRPPSPLQGGWSGDQYFSILSVLDPPHEINCNGQKNGDGIIHYQTDLLRESAHTKWFDKVVGSSSEVIFCPKNTVWGGRGGIIFNILGNSGQFWQH